MLLSRNSKLLIMGGLLACTRPAGQGASFPQPASDEREASASQSSPASADIRASRRAAGEAPALAADSGAPAQVTEGGAAAGLEASSVAPHGPEARKRVSIWERLSATGVGQDKFSLEGSVFAIGDPVHETMTLLALQGAGYVSAGVRYDDPRAREYLRGVFWNDDPCGQLFAHAEGLAPSLGVKWYIDFRRAKAGQGGLDCGLLGRSHFGDLQFFHGMASEDGIDAASTANVMLIWAEFLYGVASGAISGSTPLRSTGVSELLNLPTPLLVSELFSSSRSSVTRARAAGALLHTVQDSLAAGHVGRDASGQIVQFYAYAGQDERKHAADDGWGARAGEVASLKGGADAVLASTVVLRHLRSGAPWSAVASYLTAGPWALSASAVPSGPGVYARTP